MSDEPTTNDEERDRRERFLSNLLDQFRDFTREQQAELAHYRAAFASPDEAERVSEALPRTADGVAVVPGDIIWVPASAVGNKDGCIAVVGGWCEWDPGNEEWSVGFHAVPCDGSCETIDVDCGYSTPEAARAAAEGGEK